MYLSMYNKRKKQPMRGLANEQEMIMRIRKLKTKLELDFKKPLFLILI